MTSPASEPIIVKPTMLSSVPTRAFMNPCFSSVASVRSTALIGNRATRTEIPLTPRLALAQSDARQRRVGEHAIRNQTVTCTAVSAGEVVANDPEIIHRRMRKLRTAGTLADRPDCGRARFQPLVDANVAAIVQLDPGHVETGPVGVRNATSGGQDVAAFNRALTRSRPHRNRDLFAGTAAYEMDLGRHDELNAFGAQDALQFIGNIGVFSVHDLRGGLDDGHPTAKTAIGLCHLEADIAPAKKNYMPRGDNRVRAPRYASAAGRR